MKQTHPTKLAVIEVIKKLRGSEPSRMTLEMAAVMLEHACGVIDRQRHEIHALAQQLSEAQKCLRAESAGDVNFQVDRRGEQCRVVVDKVTRFYIRKCRNIQFDYALAAAMSDDGRSWTVPPMKWGTLEEKR